MEKGVPQSPAQGPSIPWMSFVNVLFLNTERLVHSSCKLCFEFTVSQCVCLHVCVLRSMQGAGTMLEA